MNTPLNQVSLLVHFSFKIGYMIIE